MAPVSSDPGPAGPDSAAHDLLSVEAALLRRWPETRIEPSLDRIRDLVTLLGDPQSAAPVIHVAGTNGKTTTARIIDGLLREHGLRTGRFTSPHLDSVTERICLDGVPVDDDTFVSTYRELAPFLDLVDARHPQAPLSFFEVLTAMAFMIFADAPVDVAVIEVGMGGSWDATNVVDAQVSVVMPVGMDHGEYLGDTLSEVASEKAGILMPGGIGVVAEQDPDAADVIADRAAEVGVARLLREGVDFQTVHREVAFGGQSLTMQTPAGTYTDVVLRLFGEHQAQNAVCALTAVEAFLTGSARALDAERIAEGMLATTSPGRLEVVRRSPTVVVDAAHNPHGARALAAAVADSFSFVRLVGLLAVLGDKDIEGLLHELDPILDHVVVTRNSSPRSLTAAALGEVAIDVFGEDRVTVVDDLPDALEAAVSRAEEDGALAGTGVLATGSVVTVADVRRLLDRDGTR